MSKAKQIEEAYNKAVELALEEVELRARKILKQHPNLDEFIMCMGGYFFTYKKPTNTPEQYGQEDISPNYGYCPKYCNYLFDFLSDWDEYLHLSGAPMRFTANGPKVTNWGANYVKPPEG